MEDFGPKKRLLKGIALYVSFQHAKLLVVL